MGDESIELAADGVACNPTAAIGMRSYGPPYPIGFELVRGERWPAVRLVVSVCGYAALAIETTEPRLQQALRGVLEQLS